MMTDRSDEIPEAELAPTLHSMGCARGACLAVMTTHPIRSAHYRGALALRETIDRIAGLLTGDPEYFFDKGHSTKG